VATTSSIDFLISISISLCVFQLFCNHDQNQLWAIYWWFYYNHVVPKAFVNIYIGNCHAIRNGLNKKLYLDFNGVVTWQEANY
jgi:hypothetical protein